MRLTGFALVISMAMQPRSFSTAFSISSSSSSSSCSSSVRSCTSSASLKYMKSLSSWKLHASNNEEDEEFDPLRSPHSYPNGIDSKNEKEEEDGEEWTPFHTISTKDDFRGSSESDYNVQKVSFTGERASSSPKPATPTPSTPSDDSDFDPRISPHAYPIGTSSKPIRPTGTNNNNNNNNNPSPTKIGVLLIDHGSKRPSSNEHLLNVASLYQSRAPENVVVRAAHMEIAPPFIKDGIEALWREDGCDKVVCHPYFLSPGRHVVEDVPELIYGAVVELNGGSIGEEEDEKVVWDRKEERLFLDNEGRKDGDRVEVVMTDPVGSNIERMVDIVGDMVEDAVGVETLDVVGSSIGEKEELGGFFGNVQRMMDEQL